MAGYIPELSGYSGQGAFRYWCQKVLPLVYDDSLSYYELLNKMVIYLNNTIKDVATVEGNVDSLLEAYKTLKYDVDHYFETLDVQEQINTKLDWMAEHGELSALIEPLINEPLDAWLSENVIIPTGGVVTLDASLTSATQAAPAKVTGDEIAKAIKSSGVLLTPTNLQGYTSADDFPRNSVIGIGGTVKAEHIANLPVYEKISCVITTNYSMSSTQIIQLFISEKLYATRIKTGSGWRPWFVAANDADTPSYRPFAKNDYSSLAEVPDNTIYVFSGVNWSDLPTGVRAGAYYSFRYSPDFKTQIVFCINEGNISVWWRIVERNVYSIYVPWQKISSETDLQEAIRSYKYIQHGSLEGFTTTDDFPVNTVIGLGSNITQEDITNLPFYGQLAYIITTSYASNAASRCQIYVGLNNFAIRVKTGNTWGGWRVSANDSEVLKYNAYNLSTYPSMASTPINEIRSFSSADVSWSDIPEGVVSGTLYNLRVSPAQKMQFLYAYQGTYNIWYRIVGMNEPFTPLTEWHKMLAPEDLGTLENDSMKYISSLSTYINDNNFDSLSDIKENIVAVYNSSTTFNMPDSAFSNFIFMNMRYAPNYNIQFAFTVGGKQFKYRIVDRRNGNIYTDWNAPDSFDGKVCLAMGDSICVGARNSHYGFIGYFGLDLTKLSYKGACISNIRVTENTDTENLCIYKQFENYANNLEHFDYYPDILIADGGINDYVYHSPLGTEPTSPITTDSEANNLDKGTISGGLQYLFYLWIKNYPKAQKYFLLTHKTYFTSSGTYAPEYVGTIGYNQTQMNDMIKKICNVYGIEVIDVFGKSMINTKLKQYVSPVAYNLETNTDADQERITNSYFVDSDGIHPLALGYREGYVPFVREALKTSTKKELLDDYMYYELDGSADEDWRAVATFSKGEYTMAYYNPNIPNYIQYGYNNFPTNAANIIKSNQFPEGWYVSVNNNNLPSYKNRSITLGNGATTHAFRVYDQNYQSVDAWRTYLSENPLKVIIKKPVFTTE